MIAWLLACSDASRVAIDSSVDTDRVPAVDTDTDAADTDVPEAPLAVLLNELLASNTDGLTDDDGEYEDWIELYNPHAENVEVEGWTLTDASGAEWEFPNDAVVPARGWLIVWCDDEDGALHASFKLAATGDAVELADDDGELVDATAFLEQADDVSWARKPGDGGESWGPATPPTPGAPNP